MGAQQSAPQGESEQSASAKTCYYELLEVERDASDTELKKAYRRKALELHPDRNINDVEVATRKFADVQAAYDVLSDPQERAWYDSHREIILAGQDGSANADEPTTFRNVRLTTAEEIMSLIRKFNATIPFNDEPNGFFGIVSETFEHLALEEEVAAESSAQDCPYYSVFGSSDDTYDPVVKLFYSSWSGFSTKKSFAWKDKYRLSDAPDRRVRRLMEKENKKCRDDAAREFNEAVRFLVAFVRKRDPRYLPNSQSEVERQKILRDAAAAQAIRSRTANQEKLASFQAPDWMQAGHDGTDKDPFSDLEVESDVEILECVACHKTFKSLKQLEAHERSKKHQKAIRQLRRQLEKEGADLELDSIGEQDADRAGAEDAHQPGVTTHDGDELEDSDEVNMASAIPQEILGLENGQTIGSDRDSSEDNDEYAPRDAVHQRLGPVVAGVPATEHGFAELEDDLPHQTKELNIAGDSVKEKVGKAKAKRHRKAARQQEEGDSQQHCNVCKESFESRTKLFLHIRQEGHAAATKTDSNSTKFR